MATCAVRRCHVRRHALTQTRLSYSAARASGKPRRGSCGAAGPRRRSPERVCSRDRQPWPTAALLAASRRRATTTRRVRFPCRSATAVGARGGASRPVFAPVIRVAPVASATRRASPRSRARRSAQLLRNGGRAAGASTGFAAPLGADAAAPPARSRPPRRSRGVTLLGPGEGGGAAGRALLQRLAAGRAPVPAGAHPGRVEALSHRRYRPKAAPRSCARLTRPRDQVITKLLYLTNQGDTFTKARPAAYRHTQRSADADATPA